MESRQGVLITQAIRHRPRLSPSQWFEFRVGGSVLVLVVLAVLVVVPLIFMVLASVRPAGVLPLAPGAYTIAPYHSGLRGRRLVTHHSQHTHLRRAERSLCSAHRLRVRFSHRAHGYAAAQRDVRAHVHSNEHAGLCHGPWLGPSPRSARRYAQCLFAFVHGKRCGGGTVQHL